MLVISSIYTPGSGRPRGGELAADDCWLDGYQEEKDPFPS